MKRCTSCGIDRPLSDFYRNGKNGSHTSCKECQKARAREWRTLNPVEAAQRDAEKHARNREQRLTGMRDYGARNAERRAAKARKDYETKREAIKAAARAYRAANPGKVRSWNNGRRAAERRATPAWADLDLMSSLYELAGIYSRALGEPFHVDHVVPLNGATVSGLHVQDNLQVLRAVENLRKGARLDG